MLLAPHILEPGELLEEGQLDHAGRTIALFADDQLGGPLILVRGIVELFSIDETDDVAVLFDCAALSQVAQLRLVLAALFGRARKLRQRDHRHVQFFGEYLQVARDLRDFLLARFDSPATGHQLQVVNDEKIESVLGLQPPALSPHLEHAHAGSVVEENLRFAQTP